MAESEKEIEKAFPEISSCKNLYVEPKVWRDVRRCIYKTLLEKGYEKNEIKLLANYYIGEKAPSVASEVYINPNLDNKCV